jgi:hypothetical protein
MRRTRRCGSKESASLLAEALSDCTEEEARDVLWKTAEEVGMNPTELLGLDVDARERSKR